MINDAYTSIKGMAEALHKEKGSKFISFAFPVISEEEVKSNLVNLRKKYFDATHHCYAYMIGPNQELSRANDDGEPAHSAGTPILSQIRSKKLSDVLLVVVRYYGGTKLGVSGLIQAYKLAAAMALENAEFIEKVVRKEIEINFSYDDMNKVMKAVKDLELTIIEQSFDLDCKLKVSVRLSKERQLLEFMENIQWL